MLANPIWSRKETLRYKGMFRVPDSTQVLRLFAVSAGWAPVSLLAVSCIPLCLPQSLCVAVVGSNLTPPECRILLSVRRRLLVQLFRQCIICLASVGRRSLEPPLSCPCTAATSEPAAQQSALNHGVVLLALHRIVTA